MLSKSDQLKQLVRFVSKRMKSEWYGGLDIRFEHGNIVHLAGHRGYKIDNLPPEELENMSFDSIQKMIDGLS